MEMKGILVQDSIDLEDVINLLNHRPQKSATENFFVTDQYPEFPLRPNPRTTQNRVLPINYLNKLQRSQLSIEKPQVKLEPIGRNTTYSKQSNLNTMQQIYSKKKTDLSTTKNSRFKDAPENKSVTKKFLIKKNVMHPGNLGGQPLRPKRMQPCSNETVVFKYTRKVLGLANQMPRFLWFRCYHRPTPQQTVTPLKLSQIASPEGEESSASRIYQHYYYKMTLCNIPILRNTLEDNGLTEVTKGNCPPTTLNLLWVNGCVKPEVYSSLLAYQKVNHFPKSIEICRKDLMHLNLDKMKSRFPMHYQFFPKTYIIPNDIQQIREEFDKQPHSYQHHQNTWILKPASSSQGKGISLVDNFQDLIAKHTQCNQKMIASQYIANPLLINRLKFDCRIYVLVTGVNPLKIYRYKEGIVRFATQEFDMNNQDKYSHLTNYAVNKHNPNFIANQDSRQDHQGSKQSYSALLESLAAQGVDTLYLESGVDEIVVKTLLSGENLMFSSFSSQIPYSNNCFELFGFDILLDDAYKPWLIEVNMCPSLASDSPLDQKIKGNLVADMLTLVGILPYDQRNSSNVYPTQSASPFTLPQDKTPRAGLVHSLTKAQKQMIVIAEDELLRKKQFNRIFPGLDSQKYKQFFTQLRPNNQTLINWEVEKCNLLKEREKRLK